MIRIEVNDARGQIQLLDKGSLTIALKAEKRIQWPFGGVDGGAHVIISRRGKKCLAANDHEPRRYIVCATGRLAHLFLDKPAGSPAYTHITFHEFLGGSRGAIVQAGLLLEELSEGGV